MDSRCILQLCDPDALSAPDAIRLALQVSRVEPDLALNLCGYLSQLSRSRDVDPRAVRRTLELLYAVTGPALFMKICERMSLHEDPVVSGLFRWLIVATLRRMRHRP